MRDEWRGNDLWGGEGDDPYMALAFRGVDPVDETALALGEAILGPIRDNDKRSA
jgi:hypothetical protein